MSEAIKIIKILYNPPGSDLQGEHVILRNEGATPQDLTNWTLRDKANHRYQFPVFRLQPGAEVRIWTKAGSNTAHDLYWGLGQAVWNNRHGDIGVLLNEHGRTIGLHRYGMASSQRMERGMGGGGAIFCPRVSPWPAHPDLMFVSCDMTGLYRSEDGGANWALVDGRKAQGFTRFSVAFNPATDGHLIALHSVFGLHESLTHGAPGTWTPFSPALPLVSGAPPQVTAAAFSRDGRVLLVGTKAGLYWIDRGVASPAWTLINTAATTTGGTVPITDVFTFLFPSTPQFQTHCFMATVDEIFWSVNQGATWTQVTGNLPSRTSNGPYVPDPGVDPATYQASRLRGFAGGANAQYLALYVSVLTDLNAAVFEGGVYRCEITSAPSQPNILSWTKVWDGLEQAKHSGGFSPSWPLYEHLGVADNEPDTAYVSVINSIDVSTSPCWAVYKYARSQNRWSGVYDGFQPHMDCNVTPGWIDKHEHATGGLGWGVGGPARGLVVDPKNANRAVYTNLGVVNITSNGASTAPNSWNQNYSQSIPDPTRERWRTTGLEVTTTWHYYVHPTNSLIHLLCCTDIGLARSDDAGDTWSSITPKIDNDHVWNNFYELAFETNGGHIWAAVSDHHDIPHETELNENKKALKKGSVLQSNDLGVTWNPYAGAGLPSGPVVSLVYRQETIQGTTQGVLYASVFGSGVYRSVITPTPSPWQAVSAQSFSTVTGQTHPHAAQISFDAGGTLYCVVAADLTNGFHVGGLYRLSGPVTQPPSASWEKLSGGLEDLLRSERPTRRPAPVGFEFDPVMAGVLYLCTEDIEGSDGGGGIYKFDNGWSRVNVPFTAPTNNYHDTLQAFSAFFTGNLMFVTSTSHGVWWSDNHGASWQEYTALPFLRPQRITYDASDPAVIYLTTFGGGAWRAPLPQVQTPRQWTQQNPATSPSGRFGSCMAYDAARGKAILFSGENSSGMPQDTWTWNGTTWTQENPATSPPPLLYACMAYDAARNLVVLWGGQTLGGVYLNDTWTWDGNNWTRRTPANRPPGRISAVMAYDGSKIILFGGYYNGTILGDMWSWDGNNWTQLSPALAPVARWSASMAHNPASGALVLFGGSSSTRSLNDTWTWNGTTWTEQHPSVIPTTRTNASMAYDGSKILLFGGGSFATNLLNDTWSWDGVTWTRQTSPGNPPARRLASMTYDMQRNQIMLFGGNDNTGSLSALGDTWTWK
jgi:hypothetical protein